MQSRNIYFSRSLSLSRARALLKSIRASRESRSRVDDRDGNEKSLRRVSTQRELPGGGNTCVSRLFSREKSQAKKPRRRMLLRASERRGRERERGADISPLLIDSPIKRRSLKNRSARKAAALLKDYLNALARQD